MLACVQARQILGERKLEKSIGNLLYHTATRFKGSETRRIFLLTYICSMQIATEQQLTGVYVRVFCKCESTEHSVMDVE